MSNIISEVQKERAIKLYKESSLTITEIAKLCKISEATIHKIVKEKKISTRSNRDYSEEELQIAAKLYKDGMSVKEIKEFVQVPLNQLYETIDNMGIARRCKSYSAAREPKIDKIKVLEEYKKNQTYSEISKTLNISQSSVTKIVDNALLKNEIELSERYTAEIWDKEYCSKVAELIILSKNGLLVKDVAKAFKLNCKKLYYIVERMKKEEQSRPL
jgi:transposase-like protein